MTQKVDQNFARQINLTEGGDEKCSSYLHLSHMQLFVPDVKLFLLPKGTKVK